MRHKKGEKNTSQTEAVSEVLGTILLLGIAVSLFSIVYVSVLSVPANPPTPSANIAFSVEENTIYLDHYGGTPLSLDTLVMMNINGLKIQKTIETIESSLAWDTNLDGEWSVGERLAYFNNNISGNKIEMSIVDTISNSLIIKATIDATAPFLATDVDQITPQQQILNPLIVTASSSGTAEPDNVTLWYLWEGYWNDSFEQNDIKVSTHHNMSFEEGDFVVVNYTGTIQQEIRYPDTQNVAIDGDQDIGAHSNFNYLINEPDGLYDNLSEQSDSIGQVVLLEDGFEQATWDDNWDDTPSNWFESTQAYAGLTSASSDKNDEGVFSTNTLDASAATAIDIQFWYRLDDTEAADLVLELYGGTSWNNIASLGGSTHDSWQQYSQSIIDNQYFNSGFKIRFNSDLTPGEQVWIDDVKITKQLSSTPNYALGLQVQWQNIDYTSSEEKLCVKTENFSGEGLIIDVWNTNGTPQWDELFALNQNSWNNVSITQYLIQDTITIRFRGANELNDINQDTWEIDTVFVQYTNYSGGSYSQANLSSIEITKPATSTWNKFYANVDNTSNSVFAIKGSTDTLNGLSGNGNDISSITDDTVTIYGEFTGPAILYNWNITIFGEGWTNYSPIDNDDSDGWNWEFNFEEPQDMILRYFFYSIAKKEGLNDEIIPLDYDSFCEYNP